MNYQNQKPEKKIKREFVPSLNRSYSKEAQDMAEIARLLEIKVLKTKKGFDEWKDELIHEVRESNDRFNGKIQFTLKKIPNSNVIDKIHIGMLSKEANSCFQKMENNIENSKKTDYNDTLNLAKDIYKLAELNDFKSESGQKDFFNPEMISNWSINLTPTRFIYSMKEELADNIFRFEKRLDDLSKEIVKEGTKKKEVNKKNYEMSF